MSGVADEPEWMMPERRYEALLRTGDPLVQGRWALITLAVIAAAAVLASARRGRRSPQLRNETTAAGLLVLGLGAFALTRDAAHDARHPLPFLDGAAGSWPDDAAIAALPPGRSCIHDLRDQPSSSPRPEPRPNARSEHPLRTPATAPRVGVTKERSRRRTDR